MLDKFYELLEKISTKINGLDPDSYTEINYAEYEDGDLADGKYIVEYESFDLREINLYPDFTGYTEGKVTFRFEHNGQVYYVFKFALAIVGRWVVTDADFNIVKELDTIRAASSQYKTQLFYNKKFGVLYFIRNITTMSYWDIDNDIVGDFTSAGVAAFNGDSVAFGSMYWDKNYNALSKSISSNPMPDLLEGNRDQFSDENDDLTYLLTWTAQTQYSFVGAYDVYCIDYQDKIIYRAYIVPATLTRNGIRAVNNVLYYIQYESNNAIIYTSRLNPGVGIVNEPKVTSLQSTRYTDLVVDGDMIYANMRNNSLIAVGIMAYNTTNDNVQFVANTSLDNSALTDPARLVKGAGGTIILGYAGELQLGGVYDCGVLIAKMNGTTFELVQNINKNASLALTDLYVHIDGNNKYIIFRYYGSVVTSNRYGGYIVFKIDENNNSSSQEYPLHYYSANGKQCTSIYKNFLYYIGQNGMLTINLEDFTSVEHQFTIPSSYFDMELGIIIVNNRKIEILPHSKLGFLKLKSLEFLSPSTTFTGRLDIDRFFIYSGVDYSRIAILDKRQRFFVSFWKDGEEILSSLEFMEYKLT